MFVFSFSLKTKLLFALFLSFLFSSLSFMLMAILKSLVTLAACSYLGMRLQKAEWRLKCVDKMC